MNNIQYSYDQIKLIYKKNYSISVNMAMLKKLTLKL